MKFTLYDYLNKNNDNEFKNWTEQLQKIERAKLNVRLDMLALQGSSLFPHILTGTPTAGILKLRVKGKIQLRPMLCKGPVNNKSEFTLLIGATECDSKFVPREADKKANDRKKIIIEIPTRRCSHERVS